ncbi:MAG: DUF188 domain-containing protein [Treponema sp.]|jgi:uncharacterized protein YaiI (UPF0178 family)|nr:DUF188 domain-containing protein [Treponema sp.]
MKIFVDADSCPKPARDIILKAAKRTGGAVFAANRPIPGIGNSEMWICPPEDGSADNAIAERAGPGDIVVTRDIPLAARLVKTGAAVLDDRGRVYAAENLGERLSVRNFTVGLAENGMDFDRETNYGKRELKAFADSLDRLITRLSRAV